MLRLLLGLALAPTAVAVCASAFRVLWGLSGKSPSAYPFLCGIFLPPLLRLFLDLRSSWVGRMVTRFYVFTHELTHAVAAWMGGGSVLGFKAGAEGGHVDVSESNVFIALAPYCVPLLTALVVLGYRVWLWARPEGGGEPVFLFLMGLTLSFHLLATAECLWARKQPDLDAAGGVVFSLAVILLANGAVFLFMQKALFPGLVDLGGAVRRAAADTAAFWHWTGRGAKTLAGKLDQEFKAP